MTTVEEPKTKKVSDTSEAKKTISEQLEGLKSKLDGASEEAKENIRAVIDTCTKQYERAIEVNKEYVKELREQMKKHQMDTSHLDEISSCLSSSLQLSEEAIDTLIDSHLQRVNQIVDFNKKSVEQLNQSYATDKFNYEQFIALQQKNFEQSIELSTSDMKKAVEVYNNHLNLSVNFNKRFSKNIITQIDTLMQFHSKGLQAYNNWISNWWEKDK
ncbi:MAG: hypothetical protein HY063_05210 [Bacteroidetes bacterium]|nr:hypothetical protein [Bacteroidota bacterium]